MFPIALIVFRESLEAALFVGIVAAATRGVSLRGRWLAAGVGAGAAGALLLALAAEGLAAALDGVGQDAVNIGVLALALAMLLWHCIWVGTHAKAMAGEARDVGRAVREGRRAPWALFAAVALAVLREGAETVLFVGGALGGDGAVTAAAAAAAALGGLAGGAAVGAAIYAGLSFVPARHVFGVTNGLVALFAGAVASQLARALAQAGWLDVGSGPLWDSSAWLAPDSVAGTLLHALAGYDARPSAAQLAAWAATLALIVVGTRLLRAPPRPQPA